MGLTTFVSEREPSKYVAHPKTNKDIKVPTTTTKLMNHMEAAIKSYRCSVSPLWVPT